MHKNKGNANSRFGRLKAVGAGLILVTVGVLRMLGGVQVVTHWTGQPVFSWGLVAAGIVCILSVWFLCRGSLGRRSHLPEKEIWINIHDECLMANFSFGLAISCENTSTRG